MLKNTKPVVPLSTRVDEDTGARIEFAAVYFETKRADILRQLLSKAIDTIYKKDDALREAYERQKEN